MKKIILLATASLSLLLGQAQSVGTSTSDIEVYTLPNGLTVILNEDHAAPQVFGGIVVKAGGKDDPRGATGMAHYQEHMLFKGTEELGTTNWAAEKIHNDKIFELYDLLGKTSDPAERKKIQEQINEESLKASAYTIPNELSKLIKSMGGTQLNAGTGWDVTMYYNAFPPSQIEKWLDLYSHRFEKPVYRLFQAELEVVYEEKNMYSDQFVFPLLENFNRNFFKVHPYGQQTLIGTVEDLKNPSLSKMVQFFETWYVPNNMALVIVGDFDKNTIKPIIEAKFGDWKRRELPERPKYEEKPFVGREFVKMKLSPIKLAILGFRTVQAGHPDEIPLAICNAILSNESQTGLLDKLVLDNKLMAAQILSMPYQDHGAGLFLIVPKIMGQKLESAEKLVLDQVACLKKGDFDPALVDQIKMELLRSYKLSMESNSYKASTLANGFGRGQSIEDLLRYPEKLNAITRDDVIRVANTYYGDNYLAFYSKMGFPKKQKIDKPGYKPVTANTNAVSEYAKKFELLPETRREPVFIDFSKDIVQRGISAGTDLYWVKNPSNDIFSLKLKFKAGSKAIPELKYAADAMNYAYPESYTLDSFKAKLASLGCTFSVSGDDSYTVLEINGFDDQFKNAVVLTASLIAKPVLEQKRMGIIYEGEKTNRKMERSEPDNVAEALFARVRYGKNSDFINRLSLKEIKALKAEDMVSAFKKVQTYGLEIHYAGGLPVENVEAVCKEYLQHSAENKADVPYVPEIQQYTENTIYFVHKKKATQSKVFFLSNGFSYDPEYQAEMDAFNMYFGGDFSGLVLQEIREYRSMAYTAGARFGAPPLKGKEAFFVGYVGTQADKTLDAITVFDSLIRFMPEKKERLPMIQQYLLQSSISERPAFRNLSEALVKWQQQGYSEDPARLKRKAYQTLEFESIVRFYKQHLATKPVVICIVGDKRRIDMEKLRTFGKLILLQEDSLFRE